MFIFAERRMILTMMALELRLFFNFALANQFYFQKMLNYTACCAAYSILLAIKN
jgi:hypothetical protein